jgi:ribosomal protein S18 acetylase RimI-like enzyme
METELYYIHVPREPRPVAHPVEFLPIGRFLDEEPLCKALWDLIGQNFRTRGKFLAIWPCVRYVALARGGSDLAGLLLVSTPLNWQIDYVVVRPEWRGHGIAVALVHETVNQALARRVPYIMLTSRPSLRPLYEGQCGFTVVESSTAGPERADLAQLAAAQG